MPMFNGTLITEIAKTLSEFGVDASLVDELVELLCADPTVIVPIRHQIMGCKDPDDDHLFETAIVGRAKIIVSRDRNVLNVPKPLELTLRANAVQVMSDKQFLAYLRTQIFSPLAYRDAFTTDDLQGPSRNSAASSLRSR